MAKKFLIVGRGLAGAILSLRFQEQGIAHDIIDQPGLSNSSRIAAGLVNPIVLKRLKVVYKASEFLANAQPFYQYWEEQWRTQFYQQLPIYHILHDPAEANLWVELSDSPSHSSFLGAIERLQLPSVPAPNAYGIVEQSGWLDTAKFLDLQSHHLPSGTQLIQKNITTEDLVALQQQYDKVIIANGHLARRLLPSLTDFFTPTRGEVMIIKSADLPDDKIIHGPVFILPLGDGHFKVGATYHWDQLVDKPSKEGLQQLQSRLEKIYKGPYRVLEHMAGVRPNIKDRKPLLGKLKDNLFLFNGLGSRGVLMAPALSAQFCEHLLHETALPWEFNWRRFQS